VPSDVNHDSSVVLESYTLYSNPLCCEDKNIFLDDESTLMGKDYDEKEGDICFPITSSSWRVAILDGITKDIESHSSLTYEKTMVEFVLQDTFLIIYLHLMLLMLVERVYFMLIIVSLGQTTVSLTNAILSLPI